LKEIMTPMGIRLKNARERMGLTQDQVARLIDVNRVEISYYETGSREISLGKLAQLANLYGCSVDYFLSVDDSDASGVAVAFRAENLSDQDLEIVAWARGLVSDMAVLDDVLKERGN
jgi:transcriptional regulator with XRE-family HTH domain